MPIRYGSVNSLTSYIHVSSCAPSCGRFGAGVHGSNHSEGVSNGNRQYATDA